MNKGACYSCKGPGLSSQHPHGGSLTACNSSSRGSGALFWPLYTDIFSGTYKLKKKKKTILQKHYHHNKTKQQQQPHSWGGGEREEAWNKVRRCKASLEAGHGGLALLGQNGVSVYERSFLQSIVFQMDTGTETPLSTS